MSPSAIEPVPTKSRAHLYRLALGVLILLNLGKTLTFIGTGQAFPESDGVNYWKMGTEIFHGDWLLRERACALRPPALPIFVAVMQAAFGEYALVAISVVQHLFVFATALMTAWICAKVSRSRAGALIGLALSFCCISRSCFAVYVIADNPLCMVLILYLAVLLAWLRKPSCWTATALGALIALGMLFKPVFQVFWMSTLALMAYQLWRSSCLTRFWRHAVVLLAVMGALLAPWYIRNKIVFGEYFFTRFTGRTLWVTCHGRPEQMPVDASDGPRNRALAAQLEGTGATLQSSTWVVNAALLRRGYAENEVDKLMESAMLESILAHPGQYAAGRVLRFAWFWVIPKAWCDVPWGWYYSYRGLPVGWPNVFPCSPETFVPEGQVRLSMPFLAAVNTAFLRVVWHPNSYVNALAALAAAAGCLFMIRNPVYREAGLAVASVLLAISLTTACFTWPEYRFRLPLEPVMIVAVAPALLSIWNRLARRIFRESVQPLT